MPSRTDEAPLCVEQPVRTVCHKGGGKIGGGALQGALKKCQRAGPKCATRVQGLPRRRPNMNALRFGLGNGGLRAVVRFRRPHERHPPLSSDRPPWFTSWNIGEGALNAPSACMRERRRLAQRKREKERVGQRTNQSRGRRARGTRRRLREEYLAITSGRGGTPPAARGAREDPKGRSPPSASCGFEWASAT